MKALYKYTRTYILGFQNAMEYRVDFLLSIFSGSFIIIVQCFLWSAIFMSSQADVIYGYNYPQMITYSVFSGIVSKLVSTGFEWEMAADIKNGGLNKFLAQPVHYFSYRICSFLGRKTLQTIVLFIIMAVTIGVITTRWSMGIEVKRFVFFVIAIFFAMLINFFMFYCISMLAFVMTEVWGVFIAFSQGIFLLSGGIFPLDIFGEKVVGVSHLLPFEYVVFFPVNILTGHISYDEIGLKIIIQVVWIIIFAIIANRAWKLGMKKYVAVGG